MLTSLDINLVCYRLQVQRVNATTDPTKMVDLKADRNGANEMFIGPAMGANDLHPVEECAIATALEAPRPKPASVLCDLDPCEEAFLKGSQSNTNTDWFRHVLPVEEALIVGRAEITGARSALTAINGTDRGRRMGMHRTLHKCVAIPGGVPSPAGALYCTQWGLS